MLSTRISFINAIAILCDKVGADIKDVSSGLGLDPRVGRSFLNAGLGYGGSCFPKDTWALIAFAKKLGYDFKFLRQVDMVNADQVDYFLTKIKAAFPGGLKGKILTVLGLSFKPETDDMRQARSVVLIKKLLSLGASVRATDPVAIKNARPLLPRVKFFTDSYQALSGSDGLVLVTEWAAYAKLDFKKIKKLIRQPYVFDGRNFFDPAKVKAAGFHYFGLGRP